LGQLGELLGAGGQFERRLQHDLQHFATMVEQAPPGALDPTSSSYLFHADSAASKGRTTLAQDESMGLVSGDVDRETIATTSGTKSGVADTTPSTTDVALDDPAIPRIPGTSATRSDMP
jgi:hypothetical protein